MPSIRSTCSPLKRLVLLCSSVVGIMSLRGSEAAASERVRHLLANMTLQEKIGQMAQLDLSIAMDWPNFKVDREKIRYFIRDWKLGSFLNTPWAGDQTGATPIWSAAQWREAMRTIQEVAKEEGVLPLLHGIDSVHGANYVQNATIFPHQHGLGATFNPIYAYYTGQTAAQDTMAAGIQWIFGPILDLGNSPRWARMYETFGEDPLLVSRMGVAAIKGVQEYRPQGDKGMKTAACMKHFIAYGGSSTGQDQSPVLLDKRDVMNYYLPPYRAAVKAGVMTAMESYQEISGVPMVSSSEYLNGLLRHDIGFEGMLVTDYGEIEALHGLHAVAADNKDAVAIAMSDTSIDMSMVAWSTDFMSDLLALVQEGKVQQSRIDEAVTRILTLKEWTGILDKPMALVGEHSPLDNKLGSMQDRNRALDAARESMTLLKNNEAFLPLSREDGPLDIVVVGVGADSLACQCGGWTVHWHGPKMDDSEFGYGTTVLEGIQRLAPEGSMVDYYPGGEMTLHNSSTSKKTRKVDISSSGSGRRLQDVNEVMDRLNRAGVIVAVIGEPPYAEADGNIQDLKIAKEQETLMGLVNSFAHVPVVVVLLEGRPRLLGDIVDHATAVIHAYLPGPDGGVAIAETLFGVNNPSGRLSFTYPKFQNFPLQYYHKVRQWDYDVQWGFGAGLHYTTFNYTKLTVTTTGDEKKEVVVSVKVTNTGTRRGKHSVLLFATDVVRRVSPEYKLLKGFEKVTLGPKASTTVIFRLKPLEDLAYYGVERHRVLEGGDYLFAIGPDTDCRKDPHKTDKDKCAPYKLELSSKYNAMCDAACEKWDRLREGPCKDSLDASHSFSTREACNAQCREQGWDWSYVDCLEARLVRNQCSVHRYCRDVFQ